MAVLFQRNKILQLFEGREIGAHNIAPAINRRILIDSGDLYHAYSMPL
jgi:hypothetical protein